MKYWAVLSRALFHPMHFDGFLKTSARSPVPPWRWAEENTWYFQWQLEIWKAFDLLV